jgi:tRNA(Ile2) C34 agmatinyltransferase TiaS
MSEQADVEDAVQKRYEDRASYIAELIATSKSPDELLLQVYRLAYRDGFLDPYPHRGACPDCGALMKENGHGWRCSHCKCEWWRR